MPFSGLGPFEVFAATIHHSSGLEAPFLADGTYKSGASTDLKFGKKIAALPMVLDVHGPASLFLPPCLCSGILFCLSPGPPLQVALEPW